MCDDALRARDRRQLQPRLCETLCRILFLLDILVVRRPRDDVFKLLGRERERGYFGTSGDFDIWVRLVIRDRPLTSWIRAAAPRPPSFAREGPTQMASLPTSEAGPPRGHPRRTDGVTFAFSTWRGVVTSERQHQLREPSRSCDPQRLSLTPLPLTLNR